VRWEVVGGGVRWEVVVVGGGVRWEEVVGGGVRWEEVVGGGGPSGSGPKRRFLWLLDQIEIK